MHQTLKRNPPLIFFLKSLANSVGCQMQNKRMTVHTLFGWICTCHRTVFERSNVVRQTYGGIALNESLYPRRSALQPLLKIENGSEGLSVRLKYWCSLFQTSDFYALQTKLKVCKKKFFEGSKNMLVPIQWFMVKRIPQIYCFTNVKAEYILVWRP